ncbi:nucleotidyltransferase domain-containing protein [candidate division KSB1 bacterium]|nr:nucleotidyltransferase domain-containing protein [candidate division KSB1 bacterium]NIR69159.1 nucleotidyltransferase domain-containing protein [candidate division KSB1 bacterium]NIS25670.1 nucleotidyltransferase domain-containing protein [candidate division KSB1 bacterium]NIT72538.1 nucleotidyltransferase domain-containing protein [candidate division KSB1 bacterium]NIU26347.1 nucleotidyltransferase domain-containing protein [candidate division KSB1 bacterium]
MALRRELTRELEKILTRLVQNYKPEKVILFGSLARGKVTEGTDIDLLVIKKDVPELGVDRIRELERLVRYSFATDFIVYRPDEVEERLRIGDPFLKQIFEEGKVLYDADQVSAGMASEGR